MIALTAATKQEVSGIGRYVSEKQEIARDGYKLWRGTSNDKQVLIVQTGIGRSRAEHVISSVLESHLLTALISFGFGGALIPELSVGDILLCTSLCCWSGHGDDSGVEPYHTDESLIQRATKALNQSGLNWRQGKGVTVPKLVLNTEDKLRLNSMLQAEVCEMEDYWIARVASARQIPFLAVRVIYDEIKAIMPDFERIVDLDGNLRLNRAIPYFLTHPEYLFSASALYKHSNRAKDSLATFVRSFLDIQ